jgi:CHAD domain-containing protein
VPAVPELGPEKPSAQVVKAFLVGSVDRLIAHHAVARLGNEEGVHQMRVAVRRLRSHLRTFAPLVEPTWSTEIVPDLKWLADLLGEVRDLDVLTERFEATAGDLHPEIDPLFDALRSAQEKARTALYGALRGERYRALLEKLVCSSQNPPVTPEATRPPDEVLIPQVASTWKRLRKVVRAGGKRPDSQALHEIRIRAKRARYAAEAVAGSLGDVGPKAKRFAAAAARVQDVLGEHQDAVVAQEKIRAIVGKHPHEGSFAVAAGRLIERQTRSAAEARKAWPRAWKELDRRKRRSWLKV